VISYCMQRRVHKSFQMGQTSSSYSCYRTSLCTAQQPGSFQCIECSSLGYCMDCLLVLVLSCRACYLEHKFLFDPIKHIAHSTSLTFHMLPNCMEYGTCQIPWSKTMLCEGATISITACDNPSCPIKALKHHLSCSKSIPSHAHYSHSKQLMEAGHP